MNDNILKNDHGRKSEKGQKQTWIILAMIIIVKRIEWGKVMMLRGLKNKIWFIIQFQ